MASTVTARLAFPATGTERRFAVVRVLVEDVTRVDDGAVVVAEAAVRDVTVPAAGTTTELTLALPDLEPASRYAVRAHASVSGAESFAAGDFLSTSATAPAAQVLLALRLI